MPLAMNFCFDLHVPEMILSFSNCEAEFEPQCKNLFKKKK